jgi:hypothetical protein
VSSSKTKDSEAPVVNDVHKPQEDLDAAFKETVTRAVTKLNVKEVVEKPTMDDENKTFRTRLVACWMLTNATLAIAIENLNGLEDPNNAEADFQHLRSKQNFYFAVILYSTFLLAAVRFTGVSVFHLCVAACEVDLILFVNCSACSTSSNATCSGSSGGVEQFSLFQITTSHIFPLTSYEVGFKASFHIYLPMVFNGLRQLILFLVLFGVGTKAVSFFAMKDMDISYMHLKKILFIQVIKVTDIRRSIGCVL